MEKNEVAFINRVKKLEKILLNNNNIQIYNFLSFLHHLYLNIVFVKEAKSLCFRLLYRSTIYTIIKNLDS